MKTKFKATGEQLAQVMTNAVNASKPMGMGFLHFDPKEISVGEFMGKADPSNFTSIDYWQGRMVKIHAHKEQDGSFCFYGVPRSDYQSWSHKYSSYAELLASAGVESNVELSS